MPLYFLTANFWRKKSWKFKEEIFAQVAEWKTSGQTRKSFLADKADGYRFDNSKTIFYIVENSGHLLLRTSSFENLIAID